MSFPDPIRRLANGTLSAFALMPIALLTVLLTSIPSLAHGQVRSAWAPIDSRYTAYATPSACTALLQRLRETSRDPSRDTLSSRIDATTARESNETQVAVGKCVRGIAIDSLTRLQLAPMQWLFLAAGQDENAEKMVTFALTGHWRKAASDTVDASTAFAGSEGVKRTINTHMVAAHNYLSATPARVSSALTHLKAAEQLESDSSVQLVQLYFSAFTKAKTMGDSVSMRAAITRMTDLGGRMIPDERLKVKSQLFAVQQHVTAPTRFDSLRKSTDAYVALQRSQMRTLGLSDALLGTTMDTLHGEFRFPASAVFPTLGKINLVVVPNPTDSLYKIFAMVRRLKQKYPGLEVVYLTHTSGTFGGQLMDPAHEADARRKWVQDTMKMPFSVIVEKPETWRLPEPDRRVVRPVTPSRKLYYDRLWLVDRVGTIVYSGILAGELSRALEPELEPLIAALQQQQKQLRSTSQQTQ